MYSFDGLEAVEGTIARLGAEAAGEDGGAGPSGMRPLVMVLPRQPGSREARVAHLLGGAVDVTAKWRIGARGTVRGGG